FYDENSNGVAGDVYMTTSMAARMVGVTAMAPKPIEFTRPLGRVREKEESERVMDAFEEMGYRIMNLASGGLVSEILKDEDKRKTAAQLVGQAYFLAYHTMDQNREQIERIADHLVERKELYGDEVVDLLEEVGIKKPRIDY